MNSLNESVRKSDGKGMWLAATACLMCIIVAIALWYSTGDTVPVEETEEIVGGEYLGPLEESTTTIYDYFKG